MIKCEICNKEFNFLPGHLVKHKITPKQYKENFPQAELVSLEQKKKTSITTKEAMNTPEMIEKMKGVRNKIDYSKNRPKFDRNNYEIKKRQYSPERNKKISIARKKFWESKKGKTVEELYGEEKGKQIRQIKSAQTKGENNPAYGKIYTKIGRKRGYYKGKLFRSLWEYSYMKFLETNNISLDDIEYESIIIKYTKNNGGRTYRPDFFLIKERKLIEIKSKWHLESDKELINIKKEAAENWCKNNNATYHILTEEDFPILSFKQASLDENVVFI